MIYVVFADKDDARTMQEDIICQTEVEAKKHAADLRKMDCSPVVKTYESEQAFYSKQAKVRGY